MSWTGHDRLRDAKKGLMEGILAELTALHGKFY
jgi:hypothetical protein